MIQFEHLEKSYQKDGPKAVADLDLAVADGEIFGFLGPNGAGKTTTIRMLCGILLPDRGDTRIDGLSLADQPLAAKTRFGLVPDNPEILGRLKAREYLEFLGAVYGVDPALQEAEIRRLSTMFAIDNVLESRIASFSHGMKQKLMICGSLLHDPANWILDEPMVGLDPEAAFTLKEEMRRRRDQGKTVFFSTHVMEVAEKICDRIGIIIGGRLVFTGTLEELAARSGGQDSLEARFLAMVRQERQP